VFDVKLQGETVLSTLTAPTGSRPTNKPIIRETTVSAQGVLVMELAPAAADVLPPIINALSIEEQ
jgi:hypothetical protein